MKIALAAGGVADGAELSVVPGSLARYRGPATSMRANGDPPIHLLVLTSLYPNAAQPRQGVFVEERLRRLVESGRISATVVAPVPWFPFRHRRFGSYAAFARVPEQEDRHGIVVLHPRYPVIPKLGMNIAPTLMYHALLPIVRKLAAREPAFDMIDAHYFYPDGVAAARLGAKVGRPVVITARGSDINVIAGYRLPAGQIRRAAERSASVVTVSEALKRKVEALGVSPQKIVSLRNGVDLERFRPLDGTAMREALTLAGPVWLAVGNLVELKGVNIILAALARVPDVSLLVIGEGPEKRALGKQANRLGIAHRVRFLGVIAHDELCDFYNVADALVLASSHEGMPNVVLESLACGTPVIAVPFESAAELISAPSAGEIAEGRTPEAIVSAWRRLQDRRPDRADVRQFAERFGWAPVIASQCALYARALAAHMHSEGREET